MPIPISIPHEVIIEAGEDTAYLDLGASDTRPRKRLATYYPYDSVSVLNTHTKDGVTITVNQSSQTVITLLPQGVVTLEPPPVVHDIRFDRIAIADAVSEGLNLTLLLTFARR